MKLNICADISTENVNKYKILKNTTSNKKNIYGLFALVYIILIHDFIKFHLNFVSF